MKEQIDKNNTMKVRDTLQLRSFAEYKEAYQESIENPEKFWASIAEKFYWHKRWDKTLEWDFKKPEVKWFQGGKLNITENCLDDIWILLEIKQLLFGNLMIPMRNRDI